MAEFDPKTLKQLQEAMEALKGEALDYRDTMRDNETFMNMLLEGRIVAKKKEIAAEQERIAQLKAGLAELSAEDQKAANDSIAASELKIAQLEREEKQQQQMNIAIKKTIAETMQLTEVYGKHEIVTVDLMARMVKLGTSLTSVAGLTGIAAGAFGGLFNTMVNLVFLVDEASSSLMRNTGVNREMADAVFANTQELARFGVSIEEQSTAFNALFGNFTDFTFQSRSVRTELKNTSALLGELGVSNADFGTGIQNTTKFFGQTADAANAAARDLASFSSIIGVAPQAMASAFSGAGDSLAKLGSDGVRAFKDLAVASKITGIEVNKLIQITDKFDTFEGAATQAGKLNAALGGNFVNAMDLMTATDPIERFEMLRDSILNTGLTFDDMSYYQRKFFAEAAGLDSVGDLAKMMSGNFTDLAGAVDMSSSDYAKLEERAKAVQSIQEELKATLQSLIPVLQPVIVSFRELVVTLTQDSAAMDSLKFGIDMVAGAVEFFAANLGTLMIGLTSVGAIAGAGLFTKLFTGTNVATKALGGLQGKIGGLASKIPGLGKIFGSTESAAGNVAGAFESMSTAATGLAENGEDAAAAIELMGESSNDAAANLAKMVKPILAIGVSVGIAAFGVSYLVEAFSSLNAEQIIGAVAGIALLGLGLAVFAKVALVAAAPTVGLSLAILAIGASVGIAAVGLSVLVKSFAGLTDQTGNMIGFTVAVAGLAATAILVGKFGAIAAPGIVMLTLGLLGLSTVMSNMDVDPFGQMITGLATLVANIEGLKMVKKEIEAISNAMQSVPANAGASIQATAALAGNFSAAPTNISFKPEQTIVLEIDGTQFNTKIRDVIGKDVVKYMETK